MAEKDAMISFDEHKRQIAEYQKIFPCYETYAKVLKEILEKACKVSFPEAFIQSRPKAVSSFAEKVVRKYAKYKDPVNEFTDLCGARVIVQTLEQVEAVKLFIKANFSISEEDEKGLNLGEDKFGYRDMHYIVKFRPGLFDTFGVTPEQRLAIGERKAELQVRT
jgi:ppGpp synthetase/RelA/SpoT-type nucleotidyltranferase